jgi:hypothetical protein
VSQNNHKGIEKEGKKERKKKVSQLPANFS